MAKTRDLEPKTGQRPLFEPPKWPTITFRKMRFSPSFDPFLVLKRPLFKAFWDFPRAKKRHHAL